MNLENTSNTLTTSTDSELVESLDEIDLFIKDDSDEITSTNINQFESNLEFISPLDRVSTTNTELAIKTENELKKIVPAFAKSYSSEPIIKASSDETEVLTVNTTEDQNV